MKDAVIFSAFVPTVQCLKYGEVFLKTFVEHYNDCDIYIGLNQPCKEWIELLDSYKNMLNLNYVIVPDNLIVDSDASGYQSALKLLKQSNEKYKTVFFCHTKGITRLNFQHLEQHLEEKFTRNVRTKVEKIFLDEKIGLWGMWAMKCEVFGILQNIDTLKRFYNFKYESCPLYITDTIYYIKGDILHNFINNCDNDFFDKNICSMEYKGIKFDRYFFERDFPAICFLSGKEFSVDFYSTMKRFNKTEYDSLINKWRNNVYIK